MLRTVLIGVHAANGWNAIGCSSDCENVDQTLSAGRTGTCYSSIRIGDSEAQKIQSANDSFIHLSLLSGGFTLQAK